MYALINIAIPGTISDIKQNPNILELCQILERNRIGYKFVDTVIGWGNLNQNWLEFSCEIETSWSWCKLLFLTEQEWNKFENLFAGGQILMIVHYHDKNGKYTPHH